jgi:hypothetical protein
MTDRPACGNCGRRTPDVDRYVRLCAFCHEIGRRLLDAGITPDDPAITTIREWNTAARHS